MNIFEYTDYRKYLTHFLESRLKRNTFLSQNSFAKKCGVSASYLSRVLKGERYPSAFFISRICRILKLTPEETVHFSGMVELVHTEDEDRESIVKSLSKYQKNRPKFDEPTFRMIAAAAHVKNLSTC